MELKELKAAIEAVLFAHAEPIAAQKLAEILEVEQPTVERVLLCLRDECEAEGRGVQLLQLEGAWQMATKQQYAEPVQKALDTRRNTPLTTAALEVLAIIAYNQPVSRSFVEQVRGVDSSSTVATLVEKGLIAETGRLDLPGRPIAFGTTDAFLRAFGIASLSELPPLHAEAQPDESDLYARPEPAPVQAEGEAQAAGEAAKTAGEAEPAGAGEAAPGQSAEEISEDADTRALRGGGFIEGEYGAAEWMGEGG